MVPGDTTLFGMSGVGNTPGFPDQRMSLERGQLRTRSPDAPSPRSGAAILEACDIRRAPGREELAELVVERACALPDLVEGYLHALRGLR